MFCTECGKKNQGTAKFCFGCGQPLAGRRGPTGQAGPAQGQASYARQPQSAGKSRTSGKNGGYGLGLFCLVAGLLTTLDGGVGPYAVVGVLVGTMILIATALGK